MCEINVIQITGLKDETGDTTALIVDGTSIDCNQVEVTIRNTNSSAEPSTRSIIVNEWGQWRVVFKSAENDFNAEDIQCGDIVSSGINVEAICTSDTNCQDVKLFKILNCVTTLPPQPEPPVKPPQTCPNTTVTPPNIAEECVNGQRSVIISGIITPAQDTIVSARIIINDANEERIAVIDEAFNQSSEFSLGGADNAFNVPPGEYTARLEVTTPYYCGVNYEPILVPTCIFGIPYTPDTPEENPSHTLDTPEENPSHTPDTPDITTLTLSDCTIWFWINLGLFIAVSILIFITLCLIEATVWAAIATIGSEGAAAAIWAALSAVNVTMIIISIGLILIALISFICWIKLCALHLAKEIVCQMLTILKETFLWLAAISFILSLLFMFLARVGCAVGAFIDVGWFTLLALITLKVGQFLGCFPRIFIHRITNIK